MGIGIGMRPDRCIRVLFTIPRYSMQPRQSPGESVSHAIRTSVENAILPYKRLPVLNTTVCRTS